jgi:hypothetical protein
MAFTCEADAQCGDGASSGQLPRKIVCDSSWQLAMAGNPRMQPHPPRPRRPYSPASDDYPLLPGSLRIRAPAATRGP